jgi:hypothetical protein
MQRSKQHLYSITSSARASIAGGTVRPSALAVLRLIANKRHSQIKWSGIRSRRYHRGMRGKLQEKLLKHEDAVSFKNDALSMSNMAIRKNSPQRRRKQRAGWNDANFVIQDLPQVISSTLKASIGRCKPLSVSSPTGSAVALPSRAARTLPSIKIWPSRASAQRRAARLTTVPIAL